MISAWDIWKAIFEGLYAIWPIWVMIGIAFAAKLAYRIWEQKRLAESGIDQIDQMDGKNFEKYLEVLFVKLGYKVERTQYIGDYGADLITQKNGIKTVIQAKRYKKKVGIKAVQEAVAAKGKYACSKAMVVTNSFYTKQAVELAKANQVELWNRDDLVKALLSVKDKPAPGPTITPAAIEPVKVATIDQTPKQELPSQESEHSVCAHCGKEVTDKVRQYCLDHSDRFSGQIYCYEHQRKR